MYLELRQVFFVNGKEFIGHLPNLGQGEHGGGQLNVILVIENSPGS